MNRHDQSCSDLPGRLARQTCPADLPGRLARQTCPADLPGRFARQTCLISRRRICGDVWNETCVLFICSAISSSAKCLRISKTESYGLSRICFEMTQQATMPSSSEKCLRISKTESYSLSRICFEMTRQATMPSSKA
jgi:hypothetical protein